VNVKEMVKEKEKVHLCVGGPHYFFQQPNLLKHGVWKWRKVSNV